MNETNNAVFSTFCRQLNQQVLSFIVNECRNDPARAGLLFGLPKNLITALTECTLHQLESISSTQACLLTLKNAGDSGYWKKLIAESYGKSDAHGLNLMALSMSSIGKNVQGRNT